MVLSQIMRMILSFCVVVIGGCGGGNDDDDDVVVVVVVGTQLVGTTALFTASKLEEVEQVSSEKFIEATDNTYTQTQLFKMEQILLQVIG
jgi:hypothetical protein